MANDIVSDKPIDQSSWLKKVWNGLGMLHRFLFFPVFSPQHCRRDSRFNRKDPPAEKTRKGKWFLPSRDVCKRVVFGLAMRVLATPLVLLICLCVIVYVGIHPEHKPVRVTPDVLGLYYEPVQFASVDKTQLKGWYVPSLKAEELIAEGDKALRRQRPGVVLCHGLGANRSQLLALAGYLHYQGFELLLFDFRACGDSEGDVRTFGIAERDDVLTAVHYLQQQPRVDPMRVAVVGQGLGGVAAVAAASIDHGIKAIVTADIDTNFQRAVARKLGETFFPEQLCSSAYVWGCRTYFRVSDPRFNLVYSVEMLGKDQQMLLFYRPRNVLMARSAMEIYAGAVDQIQTKPVDSIAACLLTDMENVAPDIGQFLVDVLGS